MKKWPEKLETLVDILERWLMRLGVPNAHQVAMDMAVDILDNVIGGDNGYMAKSDKLKAYLRDKSIWEQFTGNNKEALARRYQVSTRHVEILITRKQREERENRHGLLL